MTSKEAFDFALGSRVFARGLEWDVIEVDARPTDSSHQRRVRLCCAAGDLAGMEWDLLYPLEPILPVDNDPNPRAQDTIAEWRRYHTAWLLDQIPSPASQIGRVIAEPFQQVPLLRALEMVRPRLLLADGVGLGKTIQAGLIAAELLVRRRAHRILIIAPPGPLLRQWEQEMRLRFGLRFTTIVDAAGLHQARERLEFGGNPFQAISLCLTSIDFAKSDRMLTELERVSWDLAIIDEAHHCAQLETRRALLARVVARQSDGLLLLTATPHDGHDANFAALMALLDPSLVDGAGRLVGNAYRRHVVRRLKAHIRDPRTGRPMFRERVVTPVRVTVTDQRVGAFHRSLSDFVLPCLRAPRDPKGHSDALAFVSLLKRSLSTLAACVATLRVIAERHGQPDTPSLRRERRRSLRIWRRRVARYGVLTSADDAEAAELEAEEIAASIDGHMAAALAGLIAAGEAALPHDPKLLALGHEIRLIHLVEPEANILIYTEYAESQRAVALALAGLGGTVLTISGMDPEPARIRAAERFGSEDGIVLISTDALAEGLNLHRRCHHLIHLDLPYNPNRLEQRNGRIDRYGQTEDPCIRYCYLAGTFEERLLLKLISKYEAARACLDVMPNTLAVSASGGGLREPLFGGETGDLFAGLPRLVHSLDLAAEDENSESWRDLLREIDRAFRSFEDMAVRHGWLVGGSATPPPAADTSLPVAKFIAEALADRPIPETWKSDLTGLPGYDCASGDVRLTTDPTCLFDAAGQDMLFPGRAHPLTRRTIAHIRANGIGRVAAARGTLSVLATYTAEGDDHRSRTVFALRLYRDGRIETVDDWLTLATEPAKVDWDLDYAPWADRLTLKQSADAIAQKILCAFTSDEADRFDRQEIACLAWLSRRADDLCGKVRLHTGDLFTDQAASGWRDDPSPERRLRSFAADPHQTPERRAAADGILADFDARPRFVPPVIRLRPLGLLMLHP